jgi:hypothetical protein
VSISVDPRLISSQCRLLLKEVEEGLAVGIHNLWSGAASLFLYQDFGLKKRTNVIRAFVRYADFHRLDALIAGCRIKVQAITAGMQVRVAVLALIRNADLIHHLNFCSAIITASNQMEFRFDSAAGALLAWRWFWLPFPVGILVTGLAIFSGHF